MSAQLQVTGEAKIRDLQGPVVANSGVITALDGLPSQYVRGDGTLADIPSVTGGGASVSYYLNGSVNQGTFGGSTYYQLGESAITGVGTNFSTSTDGLLAQFITDAGVPDVTEIPSGNWNIEFYMGVSASSGALASFYVDIFKYDGTTFTLIGSNSSTPDFLTNTTTVDAYFTSVAMPLTAMAETDRIAIRVYANVAGKTVTLYTEDNRLCQVVTTFSRGMLSLNSLTDQQQYITVGTAGTDFNIVSSVDTHTFNLPVASATNTGKLSSTDWSTFNNKQNTIIDPITGTGTSTGVAYFNSGTSITSEAAFNYDASTNRLGVNTSVPNATIGANAGTDSGYSLLLKNDNANYNGIGFGTDSTYGNLISTEKQGTALTRNLTLLNQSGFVSLTEAGNLGVGLLNPNTGVDIYNSSSAYLWLHTANSGITGTDGVRLALFSTNGANLRNFDGSFSITAEGDFSVITLGAENFKINSADGSIYQSKVANAMLKSVSGVITAAVANSDYQSPISLTTSGSSGAATFSSNTLNIPNYTLSGLGGVPTSRTITINGTTQNLSTDISYTVGTIGGSGAAGRVAYYDGANSITSEAGFVYDSSTNRLGVNTSFPNASIGANAGTDSGYSLLLKNADNNYNGIGFGTDSTYGNLISTEKLGTAPARNLTLLNQSGFASLKENGSFGINTLNPAVAGVGIDIYSSTSTGIRFHTANSGTTVSDGAGINFSAANNLGISNYEAGAIDIVTNGNSGVYIASNGFVGINGATPSTALTVTGAITQSSVTSAILKANGSGLLVAAVAGTDYVAPSALSGYVPTSRTITINGNTQDLTVNSIYNVGTLTGNGTSGRIPFYSGTTTLSNSENLTWDNTNGYLGVNNTPEVPLDVTGFGFNVSGTNMNIVARFLRDNSATFKGIGLGYDTTSQTGIIYADTASLASNIAFWTFNGSSYGQRLLIASTGAATFSSSVAIGGAGIGLTGINMPNQNYLAWYVSGGSGAQNVAIRGNGNNLELSSGGGLTMTMDVNQRVGIGTSSPSQILDIVGTSPIINIQAGANTNARGIQFNYNGATVIGSLINYGATGENALSAGSSGTSGYFLTFKTDGSERMRINSTGDLLLKGSSTTSLAEAVFQNTNSSVSIYGSQTGSIIKDITFHSGGTAGLERMRITTDGAVLVGASSTPSSSTSGVALQNPRLLGPTLFSSGNVSDSRSFVQFINANGVVGQITTSGTSTSYVTSSDYRLKQDLKDYNGLDLVSAIKTYDYEWKSDNTRSYGVIAHELQEVIPQAVYGEKDADEMQGVDYSKIVPILIKSIQELQAKIVTLESKIN